MKRPTACINAGLIFILIASFALGGCVSLFKPGAVHTDDPFYSSRTVERNDVYLLMRKIDSDESTLIFGKNLLSYGLAPFVISVVSRSDETVSVDFRQFEGYLPYDSAYAAMRESAMTELGMGVLGSVTAPIFIAIADTTEAGTIRKAALSEEGFIVSGVVGGIATIANVSTVADNNTRRTEFLRKVAPEKLTILPDSTSHGIVFLTSLKTLPSYLSGASPDDDSDVPKDYTVVDVVISPHNNGEPFVIRVAPY